MRSARCSTRSALRRLYTALSLVEPDDAGIDWEQPQAAAFRAAMNDDFNTPVAVAQLFELAGEVNRSRSPRTAGLLKALAASLGFLQQPPREFLQAGSSIDESQIDALIAERAAAKQSRDFARADAIRKQLPEQGIEPQDSAQGTHWQKA